MEKYYLIGEIHGTKECPKAFFDIIKKEKIKQVALEFDKIYQNEIENFYENKICINKISFFNQIKKSHDGRASSAIKLLLIKLRANNISVTLVDDWSFDGKFRDKSIAQNLKQISGKIGFLCGNVHAMKTIFRTNTGTIKPVGFLLPKNKVVSYNIVALKGGNFYNFRIKKYKKNSKLFHLFKNHQLPLLIKSNSISYDYDYIVNKFTWSK